MSDSLMPLLIDLPPERLDRLAIAWRVDQSSPGRLVVRVYHAMTDMDAARRVLSGLGATETVLIDLLVSLPGAVAEIDDLVARVPVDTSNVLAATRTLANLGLVTVPGQRFRYCRSDLVDYLTHRTSATRRLGIPLDVARVLVNIKSKSPSGIRSWAHNPASRTKKARNNP
jgi:hypothetical protein